MGGEECLKDLWLAAVLPKLARNDFKKIEPHFSALTTAMELFSQHVSPVLGILDYCCRGVINR